MTRHVSATTPCAARLLTAALLLATLSTGAVAQSTQPADDVRAELRRQATALEALIKGKAAREFLAATANLPPIAPRTVYRSSDGAKWLSAAAFAKLDEAAQADFKPREFDERFYYTSRYGPPLIYARPLELAADAMRVDSFAGKRIFDFGYGMIGHGRMLASRGADYVGTEVQPWLPALYAEPADTGVIKNPTGKPDGRLTVVDGRWPADPNVVAAVGDGFDLFISKNVLKRGYIHPEREAEPRMLIDLGVDDETFCRTLFKALKPGGVVMIYNLSPKQAPPDEPYIPWADGRCAFERALLERVGFEVVAYDRNDIEALLDMWKLLDLDNGQSREEIASNLFSHYTILRRPK